MESVKHLRHVVVIFVIGAILTGCSLRIGYRASASVGRTSASFILLTETKKKSVKLEQGNTITFDYELKQKKGTLEAFFENPSGDILIDFETNTEGEKTVTLEEDGAYMLVIKAKDARGSYRFEWSIQ